MATLLDLSNEILTEILEYVCTLFTRHSDSTCDVALVCRRLRLLARPLIFSQVELSMAGSPFEYFVRSIDEDPALVGMVRRLTLVWNHRAKNNRANPFLARFTSVRHLYLHNHWDNKPSIPWYPEFLEDGGMPMLQSIEVLRSTVSSTELALYLSVPSLRSLKLPRNACVPNFKWPQEIPSRESFIEFLQIGWLNMEDLEGVLRGMRALRHLSIWCKPKKHPFSPAQISKILSLVFETLESLVISVNKSFEEMSDESKLDLSNAKRLRKIIVPAACFFSSAGDSQNSRDISALLPHALEEMEITHRFAPVGGAIMTPVPSDENADIIHDYRTHKSQLPWLQELLANKATHIPRLRKIKLSDQCGMELPF